MHIILSCRMRRVPVFHELLITLRPGHARTRVPLLCAAKLIPYFNHAHRPHPPRPPFAQQALVEKQRWDSQSDLKFQLRR